MILIFIIPTAYFGANSYFAQDLSNTSSPVLSNSSVPPARDLLQYEWPQFAGDSSFTRYSTGPAPEAPDILWKTNVTGIHSYISAFNGKIFVTTNQSAVLALDGETGAIVWDTTVPAPGLWPSVHKIDNNHMIVGNSCLDPNTGQLLWVSSNFSASPAAFFTDNIYSPGEKQFYIKVNSYVQSWNFSNPSKPPTLTWATYIPGGGLVGSGLQYGEGKVFPGSFNSEQFALDAKTGKILWRTPTQSSMIFSGAYCEGIFFRGGSHDNTLYAFNASNGQIMWIFNPKTEDGYFCVAPATAYGMVYELNKDGYLYAINGTTGDLIWKYKGPGTLIFPGTPTVADGKIYATTGQEAMYGGESSLSEFACLNAYTGQLIWRLPIEAFAPRESVAIAYGNLYLIPADVTTLVDSISGDEYSTLNQIWAIGTLSWSMFRHDSAHSAAGQSGPENLSLVWKFKTGGAVVSSPSIADGIAYFGSQDKNIYAVDARTSSLIWKFPTGDSIESSPAVSNGRVYTGTDDGYIYCIDAYTGILIWKTFVCSDDHSPNFGSTVILQSSPIVVENRVYTGALDNKTYAIDAGTGAIIWAYQTQGYITSSIAVADGSVYIISQEPSAGALYKLGAHNGQLIWKMDIPYQPTVYGGTDMHASPTFANGLVFVASNTIAYYGINATNGAIQWTYKDESAQEFIVCSPVYNDGKVFFVDKFSIVCVNATSGHLIWSTFTGDELYLSPTYADDKLYVVTDERHVYVLNATDGNNLGNFTTISNSWSSPAIYEGRVYFGNNDWSVYCLAEYAPSVAPIISPSPTIQLNKPITSIDLKPLFVVAFAIIAIAVTVLFLKKRKSFTMRIVKISFNCNNSLFWINNHLERML